MKKYEASLATSLILGILLFLFSFDQSGWAYMLLIPIFVVLGIPSLLLKLLSGVSFKIGYWDVLTWGVWFGIHLYYSRFLWGDTFWYVNFMFVNQLISAFLIVIPLIMSFYFIVKRKSIVCK